MTKKWPLHPIPYKYELLSQWIERLAKAYGIRYKSFCKIVLKLTPEEINNLRFFLPEKALTILSKGTDIPIDNLRQRVFHYINKKMLDEEFYSLLKESYSTKFNRNL